MLEPHIAPAPCVTEDAFAALMEITRRPPVVFVEGRGSWLTDQEGKKYLDFIQGWAVNCLGHCPTAIVSAIKSQAESIMVNFGQTRLLLLAQSGTSISITFLVVVVFWLTLLFVSFGLFAPRNATATVTLSLAAISVAGALFLILELDHPFSGLIQISSAPLRTALSVLGR